MPLSTFTLENRKGDSLLFRIDHLAGDAPTIKEKEKEKQSAEPQDGILCRACGSVVTSRSEKIVMSGSHAHTFFNPAGIIFELGCFRRAPGCRNAGELTSEFTWFAGYLWRFALCSGCRAHLGWFFEGGDNTFYGLILNHLQE